MRTRALLLALAASVLANLFLAGVLAGRYLAGHGVDRPLTAAVVEPGALVIAERVRRLSAQERARFASAMAPHRPAIRSARQAIAAARMKVEADIAAPAYDPVRTAADLAALRAARQRQQVLGHEALVEALGRLAPASRAALVARVRAWAQVRAPPA